MLQVAVQRGQGNIPAAIDLLVKYLDLSPLDASAWQELSDLYIMVRLLLLPCACCPCHTASQQHV